MRLTFPKSRRLYQRRDFDEVRDRGRRLAQGCVVINWLPVREGKPWRLGIIATKSLGPAVTRNLARRRIREAFRLSQAQLHNPADIVLIARSSIRNATASRVTEDIIRALRRAGLTGA